MLASSTFDNRRWGIIGFFFVLALTLSTAFAKTDSKTEKKDEAKNTTASSEPAKKGDKMNATKNPIVVMETSAGGPIEIELFADKAPISVENFLKYADEKFYDGTIFHRVIDGFMIQGGGFTESMSQKPTKAPIKNEATNGLKNERGTLAMARTSVVDSATAQFFVNVVNNDFLNHKNTSMQDYGYAVFGKVISGMDIVDKIKNVPTARKGDYQNVPVTPVVIKSIKRK